VQAPDPACRVLQAGLALVGEQDRFIVVVEGQVAQALEALTHDDLQHGSGSAGAWMNADQAMAVVDGKQHTVGLDLQAIGPTGAFGDQGPVVVYAEDAAVGDLDDIQPAPGAS
jgi:hypothetical protein